jgi:glycosyltransferase involved in cell wall biosynthesis
MQEPEPQASQDPQEEIELLRKKLRRLEAEHAEVQQKLFDQYEWTREKTKAFDKELRTLRSISLEYQILDFLWRIYQRTTGLPMKTLEEDVEDLKIFLAAVPIKNDPNTDAWLRSLLRQTHANFEIVVVIGNSDPEPAQDIKDSDKIRVVRTEDQYSDAVRANIGLCFASGDIWGVIAGGYWPYPGSVENVARFFAENRTCQVMLPANINFFSSGLIAPAERPHREDFVGLWKHYTGRHGSFFFSPKAYKKIGRINYEAGDAWLFGTLLQLAWYSPVERSNALVAVNTVLAPNPEERTQIESSNNWVRQHFYNLGFLKEYRKPVWYFPFKESSPKLKSRRLEIEKLFRRLRSILYQLQRRLYSPIFPLHFPAAADQQLSGARGAEVDLSRVGGCPLTERLPDRFLFSLGSLEAGQFADVFYASETSVAIISRDRSPSGSELESQSGPVRYPAPSSKPSWRFIRPAAFGIASSGPLEVTQSELLGAEQVELQVAYQAAVDSLLDRQKVTDAFWIGQRRFNPSDGTTIEYVERRAWEEYPALASGDLETLTESNLLAGRSTETGFDLIHLAGVLQLCRRPRHLLRFLAFALKFDALILVSTPNLDSSELHLSGPAWCHWDPQRTFFVYGAQSLRALMRHCGFEEKKLVSFSHPSWTADSRRNLVNAIPPLPVAAETSLVEAPPQRSKGRDGVPSDDLDGDFLIGLFSRKL